MPRVRLTERVVETARCPEGRKDLLLFDAALPGFGLRVSASGAKTFLVQYRGVGRAVRRIPLGRFGTLTPDEARKRARALLGRVADGRDPVGEKRAEAAAAVEAAAVAKQGAAKDAFTFATLVAGWVEARTGNRRPRYLEEARSTLRRSFADFLDRPAGSITPQDVVLALDGVRTDRGPIAANRSLAYARAAYGWALRRHAITTNPFHGLEAGAREVSRDRVLSEEEVGALWRATAALGPDQAAFIRVLVLCLQRRDETVGMRWSELDLDRAIWAIPATRMKAGRPHTVHLAAPVVALLHDRPRINRSDFVFAGQDPTRPLSGFAAMKRRLVAAMNVEGMRWTELDLDRGTWVVSGSRSKTGRPHVVHLSPLAVEILRAKAQLDGLDFVFAGHDCEDPGSDLIKVKRDLAVIASAEGIEPPDWRLHDLRRSGVTHLAHAGVAPHVADKLLAHQSGTISGVAAVYQRAEFMEERRRALDLWSRIVLGAAEGQAVSPSVVRLRAPAA